MHTARWIIVLACLGCSGAEVAPSSTEEATSAEPEAKADAPPAVDPAIGAANLKACKAWTDGVRSLPCAAGALTDEQCPNAIALVPNDMVKYYECMASKYTCVDGALNVADVSGCNQHMSQ